MGVTANRGISSRSRPHHRPRHRGAASPRFRYVGGNCSTADHRCTAAARYRAAGSHYRCSG
eukprot:5159147-Pleurochrysis_carterae.AAC.1